MLLLLPCLSATNFLRGRHLNVSGLFCWYSDILNTEIILHNYRWEELTRSDILQGQALIRRVKKLLKMDKRQTDRQTKKKRKTEKKTRRQKGKWLNEKKTNNKMGKKRKRENEKR